MTRRNYIPVGKCKTTSFFPRCTKKRAFLLACLIVITTGIAEGQCLQGDVVIATCSQFAGADIFAKINSAQKSTYCSKGCTISVPAGDYQSITTTLRVSQPLIRVQGAGKANTRFHYAGSGKAIVISMVPWTTMEGAALSAFSLFGNPSATDGLY